MSNHMKTAALLALLSVFFLVIGRALGGQQGMVIAFIFAMIMNVGSYWYADKIVLKLYKAQPLAQDHPIYRIVQSIVQSTGQSAGQSARLPMPRVYVFPSKAPNAFATGRNPKHGVVAVSAGLLEILNEEELTGVLAHEMSHIGNRDTLISASVATMASAIFMLASMAKWAAIFGGTRSNNRGGSFLEIMAMAIFAPLAASLIQMAISRSREFQADKSAARLLFAVGLGPEGLISALNKIDRAAKRIPLRGATPATSHMFIINPISGFTFSKLFSTHPPVEERIAQLRRHKPYGR